ncbi:MAG: hypothetical protein HRU09_18455 [Oligoflexales bacterium]|nr:hypothetical protein [Oligoflexales bacterium]
MLKIAISASFILSSFCAFGGTITGEELASNATTTKSNQYYLLKPDTQNQKRFYYLVKNKDKYSATKLKLIDFQKQEVQNFEFLRNTFLQVPQVEK